LLNAKDFYTIPFFASLEAFFSPVTYTENETIPSYPIAHETYFIGLSGKKEKRREPRFDVCYAECIIFLGIFNNRTLGLCFDNSIFICRMHMFTYNIKWVPLHMYTVM
jgi:hypothetical protein